MSSPPRICMDAPPSIGQAISAYRLHHHSGDGTRSITRRAPSCAVNATALEIAAQLLWVTAANSAASAQSALLPSERWGISAAGQRMSAPLPAESCAALFQ